MIHRRIRVPESLAASHRTYFGEAGRAWITALPALAEDCLDRWQLRLDGTPRHGAVALVLPVVRADGTPAALKLQPVDEETAGEPAALRAWAGHGAVALLEADPRTGAMLLERLDAERSLGAVEDDLAALQTLSEILSGLVAVPPPDGLRRLDDLATAVLVTAAAARQRLSDPADRRLLDACAGSLREVLQEREQERECGREPVDRLLHWDLHYDNVLAGLPSSGRETGPEGAWLAIDPKPLVGDPGFDLYPALWNRWADVERSGNVERSLLRRFDLMTEVVGLDRQRAAKWTLGRVLQTASWSIGNGEARMPAVPAAVARVLVDRTDPSSRA
ncbi:aminoglycoside phosphotransferase family protein [Streptacidiphilus sp. N1-3]|uniref:Aminoglycoside phosphotransferase family protein n=1 Tax=Streptacidiphilus alkalitolerans TaxID=3342712 RepID=A0ABV6X8U4_9ACTN